MSEVPHAVLSEHFQARLKSRRLISAVFTTFEFEPAFFELEILPVFFDVPLSHVNMLRWVQLEEVLRKSHCPIAVYYDTNGLQAVDGESPKLNIQRLPVRHRTGIFHPKNVFLLVEEPEPDEYGNHAQALLVASMSANLTRAGWWRNVEVCHVEEIAAGAKTRLRDELLAYLETLKNKVPSEEEHAALMRVREFLRSTEQRAHRSSNGFLHTHFYRGTEPFADFLAEVAGADLSGMNLEIISPFFDKSGDSKPLEALIERFAPNEVRLYLPRNRAGDAIVPQALYESVRELPEAGWGHLARGFLKMGPSEEAGERNVHAKVYRFFSQRPKRELLFVGSVNLTQAAHQRGGNLETGFLVEIDPPRRPDFWLTPEERPQTNFAPPGEAEETAASGGTRLTVRYWWNLESGQVYWDAPQPSPALRIEVQGCPVFDVAELEPRTWTSLSAEANEALSAVIRRTSLLTVHGDRPEPGTLLVQEEGMSHKPSLLMDLSTADILRYWSLLTVEQRAAFIEAKGAALIKQGDGLDLVTELGAIASQDTLFDRFAGFFHAFGCLERSVVAALDEGNQDEALYRVFGRKYDSLGNLLGRLIDRNDELDLVDQYLLGMCARQLCQQVERHAPDFWAENADDVHQLMATIDEVCEVRAALGGENDVEQLGEFLGWFDRWFLKRAEPLEVVG